MLIYHSHTYNMLFSLRFLFCNVLYQLAQPKLHESYSSVLATACVSVGFSEEYVLFSMLPSSKTSAETTGLQHLTFPYRVSFRLLVLAESCRISIEKEDKPNQI